MNAIVNADANWGIGDKGDLIFPIPEDTKYFYSMTKEKIVIMGRGTLDSLPGGKPLPNRTTIVLTSNTQVVIPDVIICHNLGDLQKTLTSYNSEDVFLCGGQSLYFSLIDTCEIAYVTKVASAAPEVARFFPNLDKKPNWEIIEQSEPHSYKDLSYRFCTYRNNNVVPIDEIK